MERRVFLQDTAATAVALALPGRALKAEPDLTPVFAQIEKRHDEAVQRLQEWIRQPSIAAENRGVDEGCELTMRMLREAGFSAVTKVPTEGQPGIFATLDAGAPRTLGLYFMYDVKQADPAKWTSPPWAAALVDKPGLGKIVVGRGAVNQKGPEAAFFAILHAIRGAGRKPPVNFVLVAEGEEEIGSPHFPQIVRWPEVLAALRRSMGIFMPAAAQGLDGQVTITLGAKGVIECELVSSGERWGRGPRQDIHSSNKARVDSPAWHLVQALASLVSPDGNDPAIDGFAAKARPLSPDEKAMIAAAARRLDETAAKQLLGVQHWVRDVSWTEALELLMSRPTVNIEGLVGGYTGPGGKTILPHKAVAKLDLRLVPDMTAAEALAALKAHLAKRGFGDIEVNMTGGYDPNSTAANAGLIRAPTALDRRGGIDPAAPVDRGLRPNQPGVGRRAVGVVPAGHVDLDIPEAAFRQVRLERGECLGRGHIGDESQVEFGDRPVRQDGFATRPGVAAHEAFDVDGGARHQELQRLTPAHIVHPVVHADLPFRHLFIETVGRFRDHGLFRGRERSRLVGESVDRGVVAVGRDESSDGFDQVPRRAVQPRFVARVDVALGPAAPTFAARDELQLDHALGAEGDDHLAVEFLRGRGHEDPHRVPERGEHLRPADDLGEVRRADLFFTFGHEHQVDRELPTRAADRVQCGQERRLGALLVHGASADQHGAHVGLLHQRGGPWWRRPFRGIDLLHVIHEIHAQRPGRARVQRREDPGLAVGGHFRDLGAPGVAQ